MERVLISRNDSLISQHLYKMRQMENVLQQIADEYKKFQVGHLEYTDVYPLIQTPEGHVKEKLLAKIEPHVVAGFSVKKALLVEQLDIPSFEPLTKLCKQAESALLENNAASLHGFVFDKGQISIDPDYEKDFTERYSVFAETEEEIELYNQIKKFTEAWEAFDGYKKDVLGIDHTTTTFRTMTEVKPYEMLNIPMQYAKLKRKSEQT